MVLPGEPNSINIVANGIRQHALCWGHPEAPNIAVLLHGCGSNAWFWQPLGKRLEQHFGRSLKIIALDHRGCGDSEKPDFGYTPDVIAQDVLGVIEEESNGGPVTLIGHSRGGWMTAYLAGHYPEVAAGAILVDPARMVWPSLEKANEFYDRVGGGLGPFENFDEAVATNQEADPRAIMTDDRLLALRQGLREDDSGMLVGKMPPRVLAELRAVRLDDDVVGPFLSNMSAPSLLLVSSQSDEIRQSEKLAYAVGIDGYPGIADVQVEFVDASHYLHQDRPDEVADIISRFMRSYVKEQANV